VVSQRNPVPPVAPSGPPLRVRFAVILVAIATLLLGGATLVTHHLETRSAEAALLREVDQMADQLAASLALPVWYLDEDQIQDILERALVNRQIREVAVEIRAAGNALRARSRGEDGRLRPVPAEAEPGTDVAAARPIFHDGHLLGQVRATFSRRPMEAALHARIWREAGLILLLDLLLVAGLRLLLWRTVLRPLEEIRRLARAVASGDPGAPVPAGGPFRGEFAEVHQDLFRAWDLLKERYRSLGESEARYRAFFEHGPDGIVVLDPASGRILAFNDQACRQLGYDRETFAGLTLMDVEAAEGPEESRARIRRIMEAGHEDFEARHRTREGRLRDVHVTAQYIRTEGGGIYHCVWRDVTERKALQDRLTQAQKMEGLGRLAGGVAHDMNNVLAAIQGLASVHGPAQPEGSAAARAFATIVKACERGGKTVRSLLAFARKQPEEVREADLNALLQETVQLLERTTLAAVRLRLDLVPGAAPIHGDVNALSLMLMNLCVNAVDAMPGGGDLVLATRLDGAWVEVRVADSGMGMAPEVLARACEPFFTTKPPGKGTGLGLSMAFSTMKAHGGSLEILSEPGRGTEVRLRFPAAGSEASPQPVDPGLPGSGTPLRVLVADDDPLIREATAGMLVALGHAPTLTASGEEALDHLEAGLAPDALVLDLNMPGLGGSATLARVRQRWPDLPVLLASGSLDTFPGEPGPRLVHLPKPFGLRDLDQKLRQLQASGS